MRALLTFAGVVLTLLATTATVRDVYPFAASEGLNAWFRSANSQVIGEALMLRPGQRILFFQSVGNPPKQ
jgi:hypothetical protein